MTDPFVSVIIPAYNDSDRLAECLDLLERQTYPADAYEVIVVDNASDEPIKPVVDAYAQARYGYEPQPGSYAARNRGIGLAGGQVLAFTDSDCRPALDWVEHGVRTLRDTEASLVGGRIHMTFQNGQPNVWEYCDASVHLRQDRYVAGGFAVTANLFVERGVFEQHGLFRNDLVSGGDSEFGRRVTSGGETLVYGPNVVVEHPARHTFAELLKKKRRLVEGRKQKEQATGRAETLTWRDFMPVSSFPPVEGVELSSLDRVGVQIALTLLKQYVTFRRLLT